MTTTAKPQIHAQLFEDGRITGEIDGEPFDLVGRDLNEARVRLIQFISTGAATSAGEPVIVNLVDPSGGPSAISVDEQGKVQPVATHGPEPKVQTVSATADPPAMVPMDGKQRPVEIAVTPVVPNPTVSPDVAVVPAPEAAESPEQPLTRRNRPTASDFSATKKPAATGPAELRWQGVLNRLMGGALKLAPGAYEMQVREWRSSIQRGVSGHKTIATVNIKGGATKTTSTYCLAATIGRVRGGNILAWDNNENKGTLGDRSMPANHDHTAIDLLENIDRFSTPSNAPELVNYVRSQGENKFHVLASQNAASNKEVVDGSAFVSLHNALRQFYHLICVDTGNASTAGTWQASVEIADQLVLVGLNKEDSLKTLAATVDVLVQAGYETKLANSVVLITQPQRTNTERLARAKAHFESYTRAVIVVPFDESLDDGDDFIFENLKPETRDAYLQAAAAIVDGL